MNIPQQAVDLVKRFEGFSPRTYVGIDGIPTIGFGTTAAAGVGIIPVPGMEISERQAEEYLRKALVKFGKKIRPLIKQELTSNQWAAFLSLAYNIGPGAFARSTALKRFNKGDRIGAADAILLWDKVDGEVVRGLQRRRHAERVLFLKPPPDPLPFETAIRVIQSVARFLFSIIRRIRNG